MIAMMTRYGINQLHCGEAQIPLGSSCLDMTWHDMFDVSRTSIRVYRAVLFNKLDTGKMHGLDMLNVSRQDVMSQVEFGLDTSLKIAI